MKLHWFKRQAQELSKRFRRWNSTGARGERIAAKFVTRSGLVVVERNMMIGGVEVDLVAYDEIQKEFVLLEIKTTSDESDGSRRINSYKRRRYARAVRQFPDIVPVRVEAIAISLQDGGKIRRWIK